MSGANPFLGIEDFLKTILPNNKTRSKKSQEAQISLFASNNDERAIMQLLSEDIRDGDIIMEQLGMDVSTFNQTVTTLEIKGAIRSLGANYWTLA
jgi:predicted Rossmann fold nucleotide-binding protein DprA/Smf involved in DNA uptake